MALFYRITQSQAEDPARNGKWYAHAAHTSTVTTAEMAEIMERNATCKASDVRAVVREMVDVLQMQLRQGHRVVIDGLGSFKLGLTSSGAATAKDFDVKKNIKGAHVIFQPESNGTSTKGHRNRKLVVGVELKELPQNTVTH